MNGLLNVLQQPMVKYGELDKINLKTLARNNIPDTTHNRPINRIHITINLMLQAQSLDINYKTILLDENQKRTFQISGIKEPVAAILLHRD